MGVGLAFWILMLIWAVFGLLTHFGYVGGPYAVGTSTVLLSVLFALLGWQVFGAPLRR